MTLSLFNEWLDEWELVLKSGTVAAGTRKVYLRGVRQFLTWLPDGSPDVAEPGEVTDRHITAWMGHLTNVEELADATRRVRLLAVRFWFDYMASQRDSGVTTNPAANTPLPVPVDKPVPVVPDEELVALLRTCAPGEFVDRRDEAIIRLLLDTGIRRAELIGIDLVDLDMTHQEATVTGKGNRTRIVPFGSKTAIALRKYLRVRSRRPNASHPALFLSIRPHASGECRLTGGGVGEMFTRRCKLAGLGHKWPHMLRHTWAHDMLDNGANEGVVEQLGGWSKGSKMLGRYGASMANARARKRHREMGRGNRV